MRISVRIGVGAALVGLVGSVVSAMPATAALLTAAEIPGLLAIADETTTPSYDRDRFEHWIDADDDGCNTRYEVLIQESLTPVTVTEGCELADGSWVSVYDGFTSSDITEIQIDHVVALAEAWRSGASAWDDATRQSFANDLDVPYSLAAVSGTSNQAKADSDPSEWMPTNTAYHCEYVIGWSLMKYRWSLSIDAAERDALESALSGDCGATLVDLPEVVHEVAPGDPVDPVDPVEPEDPGQTIIDPFAPGTTRLAGGSRYDTAIAVSSRYSPGVPAVFVATGVNFPDALSGAAAAANLGGPLLLTKPNGLPPAVGEEIRRLAPKVIYLLGSAVAVHTVVEESLAAIDPDVSVIRLGGASRYATGLAIVEKSFDSADHAIIATGRSFPDALAATGAAGSRRAPVILVDGRANSLTPTTLAALGDLGVGSVTIAGGTSAVSAGIEGQLRRSGYTVARYGGANRYATATAINEAYFGSGGASTTFVATAGNFPDALAGAALAGRLSAPLYITQANCVPDVVRLSINGVGASSHVVMGSPGVVNDDAAANLGCMTSSPPTVTGSTTVGGTVTARPGRWTAGVTFTYQWYANGVAITGANGANLKVTSGMTGKVLRVRVLGQKDEYVSVRRDSANTARVAAPPTAPPPTRPPRPANPGNTKNCSDFSSWAQAQAWFNHYYPHYGDVAELDGDGDMIACESLPGAP